MKSSVRTSSGRPRGFPLGSALACSTGDHERRRARGPQHDPLRAQLLLDGLAEVPDGGPAAGDGGNADGRGQLQFPAQ